MLTYDDTSGDIIIRGLASLPLELPSLRWNHALR